ncbi:MAG: relaxase domain-containing protein [Pirellulales bacterium]|nr:relaxase domain-containing protein [Pirellulales bacterium]
MIGSFSVVDGGTHGAITVAKYFCFLATAAYYLEGGEPPGEWLGRGATEVRLAGNVQEEPFTSVLNGCHPHSHRQLVQIQRAGGVETRRERCLGVDLCSSLQKSVTALWVASPDAVRREIEQAIMAAFKTVFNWFESEIPLARSGRGGHEKEFAKLIAAVFPHTVNRNLEPHLHLHCIIANLCQRPDGSWATVNTGLIRDWTRTLGPMIRCTLAKELKKRLGVEIDQPRALNGKKQPWELAGVPEKLIKRWSSRRSEIEALLAAKGGTLHSSSPQAREKATLLSRKPKSKTPSRKELLDRCQKEATSCGFDQHAAEALLWKKQRQERGPSYTEVWKNVLNDLSKRREHFTERDVIQGVCEVVQHRGVDGVAIARRVRRDLSHSPDIVRLNEVYGEQRFTTKENWELEEKLLSHAAALKGSPGAVVPDRLINKALKPRAGKSPTEEQAKAGRELLSQRQALRILTGVAGAGKSFIFDRVRDGFERAGYTVIGGALAGAAKEELVRQTGIESRTVASYLYHLDKTPLQKLKDRLRHDARQLLRALRGKTTYRHQKLKLTKRHVLILDEAGMLDTRSLERIAYHVRKAGATLILAGDHKQLPPVLAGAPFKTLTTIAGQSQLNNNQRQRDENDRRAVHDIRYGEAKKALKNYAERGRVTIGADRDETIQKLIGVWAERGGAKTPQRHRIFTQTREDAHVVNQRCQAKCKESRAVRSVVGVRVGQHYFYKHDRVLFHKAYRAGGIENGYTATVLSVNPIRRSITVRLDQEPTKQNLARGLKRVVTVPLRALGEDAITLGYAATTHKMQGQTVDHSYMLLGGTMTNLEMTYVQATRGRESTHLFVDALHAGTELKDLAKSINKSRAKNLAHDIGKKSSSQLHEELSID